MQEFNKLLTNDEEQKKYLLTVIAAHRKIVLGKCGKIDFFSFLLDSIIPTYPPISVRYCFILIKNTTFSLIVEKNNNSLIVSIQLVILSEIC